MMCSENYYIARWDSDSLQYHRQKSIELIFYELSAFKKTKRTKFNRKINRLLMFNLIVKSSDEHEEDPGSPSPQLTNEEV